jgi:hypothetical protein
VCLQQLTPLPISFALIRDQQQQITLSDVLREQQQQQLPQKQQLQQQTVIHMHSDLQVQPQQELQQQQQQQQTLPVVELNQQVVEFEQPQQPIVLQQKPQQQQPTVEQQQQQRGSAISNPSPPDGVTKIIVTAYYRSGSTFVSDLLQLGNNSFYLFEPFYAIYAHWYGIVGYHEVLFTGEGRQR